MTSKLGGILQNILGWYFIHVKYRHYTRRAAEMFAAFEFANRAHKETNDLVEMMQSINLNRVIALYTADFDRVKELDELMVYIGKQVDEQWREQEKLSVNLWREVFSDFVLRWKDPEIIKKVWGITLPRT